ncbi:MAG: VOC family protein [Deltaproteobacteria bacterium]|nr:VOC family protein [Deltaproteobacteria bacterium]
MKDQRLIPCIWFDDQAGKAAADYIRIFPDTRVVNSSRYPEHAENPSHRPPGSVLTVELVLAGQRFTLLNAGPIFKVNPSISFFVNVDTAAEADRIFGALLDGGEALMPIDRYPWGERYGWVKDKYGVTWQVMAGRRPPSGATIVPCLMFVGKQHRRAEEAMRFLTGIFPGGRIESIERYGPGEGPEDTVKHGRFTLDGQTLVAMDSHGDHRFTFNEGLSLQVMCDGQAEVDRYWDALSEGGEPGQCGWLKDRFGISWQVTPKELVTWMLSTDLQKRDRAFAALLNMTKLDVEELRRAYG